MTADASLAIFVASDAHLEHALPFLAAFRQANPHAPLLMIPRDQAFAALSRFRGQYAFDILAGDFTEVDLLETIRFDSAADGRLRVLAAFDVAGPPRIVLDTSRPPPDLSGIRLTNGGTSCVLLPQEPYSAVHMALTGPPIGTGALIGALRENLVESMLTGDAPAMLELGLAALRIRRDVLGDFAALRTPPPRCRISVAPLSACAPDLAMLDNGGPYRRVPAEIFGAPSSISAAQVSQERAGPVRPPPAQVARLRNVTVHGRGVLVDSQRRLIRESLINADADAVIERCSSQVRRRDADGPVVLLKQTWDDNYGHWLIESLPRLGLVDECHDLSDCRVLVGDDADPIGEVYRDSLALCGIDAARVVAWPEAAIFCADLIYPAPLTVQPWVKAPRAIAFLRALGRRVPPGARGPSRIYVSRGTEARRRLRNEAALLPALLERGYVVVEPQRLDFVEQIRIFRDATHVVGNLGAGLANLAFAPTGVRLLALASRHMQDDFFWDLVSHLEGAYVSLHGTGDDSDNVMQADFDVDPETFARVLNAFDRRPD